MSELPESIDLAVVGKDCRTDALTQGLASSPRTGELTGVSEISPPGMVDRCARFLGNVSLTEIEPIIAFLRQARPGMLVIGPEEPLAAGLADRVEDELRIPCFGPRRELAQIESSKSWARELVSDYGIPGNPEFRIFRETNGLASYLRRLGEFVIKPDGLTGGKGVKVSGDHLRSVDDGVEYAQALVSEQGLVIVEERLDGEEFSLQSVTDGEAVVHCPPVQDHKRSESGDTGPNTGGMGSYSCADHSLPFLTSEDIAAAQAINEQVVRALRERTGTPYRGVLYGGFMATADGVRLLEYNARFGDPEAMNVLGVLSTDLVELCWSAATGTLAGVDVRFEPKATVCKYIVPERYPSSKGAGDAISVPDALKHGLDPTLRLYWAAVNRIGGEIVMTSSRALAVLGIGDTLHEAESRAEYAARQIAGPVRHRDDIGTRALVEKRVSHMRTLRNAPALGAVALATEYPSSSNTSG